MWLGFRDISADLILQSQMSINNKIQVIDRVKGGKKNTINFNDHHQI